MRLRACLLTGGILLLVLGALQLQDSSHAQNARSTRSPASAPRLVVQTGHPDYHSGQPVISADGRYYLDAGGSSVVLWEVATRKEIRRFHGHSNNIESLAFFPDGEKILSASVDGTVRVWEASTGRELQRFEGAWALLSPTGQTVVTHIGNGIVRVFNIKSGKEVHQLKWSSPFSFPLNVPVFSMDGRKVLIKLNRAVLLLDATTGAEINRFAVAWNNGPTVTFAPDGKSVLIGTGNRTILFDAKTSGEIRSFNQPNSPVNSLEISPDGRHLITGGNTVRLFDVSKGHEIRRFRGHFAVAFSHDGQTILTSERSTSYLLDTNTGTLIREIPGFRRTFSGNGRYVLPLLDAKTGEEIRFEGHSNIVNSVRFSPDSRLILTQSAGVPFYSWDTTTGDRNGPHDLFNIFPAPESTTLSSDGRVMFTSNATTTQLWDTVTRQKLGELKIKGVVDVSQDGVVLTRDLNCGITLWDVKTGKEIRKIQSANVNSSAAAFSVVNSSSTVFSSDGRLILSGCRENVALIWDAKSGTELHRLEGHSSPITSVAFSPDGRFALTGSGDMVTNVGTPFDFTVRLWDVKTGKEIRQFKGHTSWINVAAFSPDEKLIVTGSNDGSVRLWDAATGKEIRVLAAQLQSVNSAAFSSNGRLILTGSSDGSTRLWDTTTGEELCRLISLRDGSWVVVDSVGRFDTNNLEEVRGVHWVMPDDPMHALPLEIYMRDYYEPQLFPRLLKCTQTKSCDQEFKPVRDIAKLSRVQPLVQIKDVSIPDENGYVNVTLEIGPGEGKGKQGKNVISAVEVFDLRLFRDGQMVAYWPQDSAERRLAQSNKDSNDAMLLQDELNWRHATKVPLGPAGRKSLTARVRLPKGKDLSKTEFTAYAFNEDRVKSGTARWIWPSHMIAKLPMPSAVKRRAYIITIGVNASENPSWRLQYAVNDALKMQQILSEKLKSLKQADGLSDKYEVVSLPLVSDYSADGQIKSNDATKKKIRAVIDVLAGRKVDAKLLSDLSPNAPQLSQLKKAVPDDLIVISFSSHGYADRNGNFFILPYDIGSSSQITPELLLRSISSDELSLWLRDVDAGEMVMIIDACHAAAFTGMDFKPGPMGSRGLGQLAYDKGMRILTATQANDFALESGALSQGLLSYALVEDGLKRGSADFKPRPDGKITIKEWLEYGVAQVPALYDKIRSGQLKVVGGGARAEIATAVRRGDNFQQRPSLFDFARKRPDILLSIGGTQ